VAFEAETAQEEDFDPDLAARGRLASGDLWFWLDDEQPVALAGRSRPAAGVARVGPVYTPPASRGRGYGSAVTAAATQSAVGDGAEQVVLYTDLSNPTSNAIYQQIGYVEDHDAQNWAVADITTGQQ
jgi:predicted GNAT family acetyltransferase